MKTFHDMTQIEPGLIHLESSARRAKRQGATFHDFLVVHEHQLLRYVGANAENPSLRSDDGYRAAVLNLNTLEWDSSELKILAQHPLQQHGLRLEVRLPAADTAAKKATPAIVFDASGVSEPYELLLASTDIAGLATTLSSDGLNRVQLQ